VDTFGPNTFHFLFVSYKQEVCYKGDVFAETTLRPSDFIEKEYRYPLIEKLCAADPKYATCNIYPILDFLPRDTWEAFFEKIPGMDKVPHKLVKSLFEINGSVTTLTLVNFVEKHFKWNELFPDYESLSQLNKYSTETKRIILSKCYSTFSNLEINQILEILSECLSINLRLDFILENDAVAVDKNKVLPKIQNFYLKMPSFFHNFLLTFPFIEWQRIFELFKDHIHQGILNNTLTFLDILTGCEKNQKESFIDLFISQDPTADKSISKSLLVSCLRYTDQKTKHLIITQILKLDFDVLSNHFRGQLGSNTWKVIVKAHQLSQENNKALSYALNNAVARMKLFDDYLSFQSCNIHELEKKSYKLDDNTMKLLQELNEMYNDMQGDNIFKPLSRKNTFFAHDEKLYTKLFARLESLAWKTIKLCLKTNKHHSSNYQQINMNLLNLAANMPIFSKQQKELEKIQASYRQKPNGQKMNLASTS
jgi:hypothetical protein